MPDFPKGAIVVNPAAGRGRGAAKLRRFISGTDLESWPVYETARPGDAEVIAKRLAPEGGIVAAAGGDGTISEVAAGLIGSGARLAVLPIGTGNDFSRALGIGRSLPRALAAIEGGKERQVDMMRWTAGAKTGLGINVSGCGFDAVVAERINKGFRNLKGTSAYVVAVLTCLGSYRPSKIQLKVDDLTVHSTVMLCAVANANSYGGGMLVAPHANMSDGLLNVVLVEGLSRAAFLAAFPSVFKGTHVTHPRVKLLTGHSIRIETAPDLPVLVDGELVGSAPVTFKVVPRAIQVVV